MRNNTAELIQRILEGDDAAFACLVRKYQKRIHSLAWRKTGDFHVAEDITQETFLQVYRKLATLKDPSQFPGWLYVIANRCCLKWLRKKRVQVQLMEEIDTAMAERSSYSRYVAAEQAESAAETKRQLVKNLLAKLKESDRTVITLYYFGEMTYAEIGEFLGVSVNTVATRVHRARERLKEYEPMIRQAFGSFQLSPDLTENIMREIPHVKPLPPTGGKPPIVPWTIAASTAILIVIMLGSSSQYLARFQQPYNLDATSEMTVKFIEAPIVLDLPSKPDVRNQFGNTNRPGESRNAGKKLEDTLEEEKQEQNDSKGGTILGYIKDTTLLELPLSRVQVVFVNADGAEFETQTNEEGEYKRAGLPAGRYVVNIYKKGYEDRLGKPVTVIDDGRHLVPLTMNKSKISSDHDNRGGVLRFLAHNRTKLGGPMEGLEIKITGTVGLDPPVVTGISGVHGQYRSDKLSPGTYIVTLVKNDYSVVCPMTVHADKITDARIQFPIPDRNKGANVPPAQESDWSNSKNVIRGRILEMIPSNTVLSDVKVVVENTNRIVFSDTSNANGEYECGGLSPGRYLINLHKEGYIEKKGIPIIVMNNGNHIVAVIEEDMFASYAVVVNDGLLELTHGMRKQ